MAARSRHWFFVIPALALTVSALLPSVQARGKAIAVLVEAVGGSFPRPLAPSVERKDATLDGVTGHLYVPDHPAPPVLLLPGAATRGKDDPRAVRLARSLARAERLVFVPDLTLASRRFDPQDFDRIVRAIVALSEHPSGTGPVVVLGISYGGSFALVAAADPRVAGHLQRVAVFGAYFDLVGVIQAVTTGVSLVGGTRVPWEGHPLAGALLQEAAISLIPEDARPPLRAVLEGRAEAASLPPEARGLHDLLTNRDPAATFELAERLPDRTREFLTGFSPSSVAGDIRVPVVAMHSSDDPAVPYGEAIRLARAMPTARLVTVRTFRHVDLEAGPGGVRSLLGDLWDAWTFTSWVLEPQE
ncbi:MAG TPA: alpha/beta hydrolase [Actinomycetota bacterium]|nr:alpha/beta hydrolase [Actinomycetota bacterium]